MPGKPYLGADTHDGPLHVPDPAKKGKDKGKQGAAARSNYATSVAGPTRTPINVLKKGKAMPAMPNDILAMAPRGKK